MQAPPGEDDQSDLEDYKMWRMKISLLGFLHHAILIQKAQPNKHHIASTIVYTMYDLD